MFEEIANFLLTTLVVALAIAAPAAHAADNHGPGHVVAGLQEVQGEIMACQNGEPGAGGTPEVAGLLKPHEGKM